MPAQGKGSVDTQLAEGFKELVLKRPIEKITIKEITDKAGVIRPTFYNHFQDKYELLEWIIRTELIEPMRPLLESGRSDQALFFVFSGILEEKEFYLRARRLEGQNSFESILCSCIQEALTEVLRRNPSVEGLPEVLPMSLLSLYFAKAMGFMILSWIDGGMKSPPEDMAEIYRYLINHSVEDILGIKTEEA